MPLLTMPIAVPKAIVGLVPAMTSASQAGVIVSASSEYSAGYAGWKAFDRHSGTDWATLGVKTNFWVKVRLPSAKRIWMFSMQGRGSNENVNRFVLQGSHDDVSWLDLIDGTLGNNDVNQEYAVQADTAYLYYRLFSHDSVGGSNPGLRTMQLYGAST